MPTQKELEEKRKKAVQGVQSGVEATSGSRLLDLMSILQELLGTGDKKKDKKE